MTHHYPSWEFSAARTYFREKNHFFRVYRSSLSIFEHWYTLSTTQESLSWCRNKIVLQSSLIFTNLCSALTTNFLHFLRVLPFALFKLNSPKTWCLHRTRIYCRENHAQHWRPFSVEKFQTGLLLCPSGENTIAENLKRYELKKTLVVPYKALSSTFTQFFFLQSWVVHD